MMSAGKARRVGRRGRLAVAALIGSLARIGALVLPAGSVEWALVLIGIGAAIAVFVAPSLPGVLAVAAGVLVIAAIAEALGWRSPGLPSLLVELALTLVAVAFGALAGTFVHDRGRRMLDDPRSHEEWPVGPRSM